MEKDRESCQKSKDKKIKLTRPILLLPLKKENVTHQTLSNLLIRLGVAIFAPIYTDTHTHTHQPTRRARQTFIIFLIFFFVFHGALGSALACLLTFLFGLLFICLGNFNPFPPSPPSRYIYVSFELPNGRRPHYH
jgi:hypothetical protein